MLIKFSFSCFSSTPAILRISARAEVNSACTRASGTTFCFGSIGTSSSSKVSSSMRATRRSGVSSTSGSSSTQASSESSTSFSFDQSSTTVSRLTTTGCSFTLVTRSTCVGKRAGNSAIPKQKKRKLPIKSLIRRAVIAGRKLYKVSGF